MMGDMDCIVPGRAMSVALYLPFLLKVFQHISSSKQPFLAGGDWNMPFEAMTHWSSSCEVGVHFASPPSDTCLMHNSSYCLDFFAVYKRWSCIIDVSVCDNHLLPAHRPVVLKIRGSYFDGEVPVLVQVPKTSTHLVEGPHWPTQHCSWERWLGKQKLEDLRTSTPSVIESPSSESIETLGEILDLWHKQDWLEAGPMFGMHDAALDKPSRWS